MGTSEDDCGAQLTDYVDAGGNLVDTANIYGGGRSEEILGRLLRGTVPREDIVLCTKAVLTGEKPPFGTDASAATLLAELTKSLNRLGLDHVDVWQMHIWDDHTPLDDTLDAIQQAISSGRARTAGLCNYTGWQTAKAATTQDKLGRPQLSSVQVEYSLLQRGIEREVLPAARHFGLGILPWAPLGRGVLTGKYRNGVPAERADSRFFQWYVRGLAESKRAAAVVEEVATAAEQLGVPPLGVALSWVRDREGVVAPLVGARTAEQLRESLAVAELDLPPEIRTRLDQVSEPHLGYPERAWSNAG
ncbi:aryl-alcohol dehydrogenase-like predicted oxidoreductase [Kutzneria viridogrisea]|uniref:Aryl-alcohol dehydrogenase-like predicted oxidoreductase n=1 Tax=Kutzneria viridogrisea TaxID=47990 RepID=A0ABR6B8X1_9PSEU|nr:aryl-alcohol dehydrogenase-like predicted oxidoreductase [Kutzneria viridogrisea]